MLSSFTPSNQRQSLSNVGSEVVGARSRSQIALAARSLTTGLGQMSRLKRISQSSAVSAPSTHFAVGSFDTTTHGA